MLTRGEKDGRQTVTVTLHGRQFTFYNSCTHFPDCDLGEGKVVGSTIVCSCGWQYDLLTGRGINHPLATIEKVKDDSPA